MINIVAPHAGAWIETHAKRLLPIRSLPVRGRGSKRDRELMMREVGVAPHAGAWIETVMYADTCLIFIVAPHAGAWIETITRQWECPQFGVAPHAGAWIETYGATRY